MLSSQQRSSDKLICLPPSTRRPSYLRPKAAGAPKARSSRCCP